MKLGEIATLIRSKNAGPFMLTIDIMFNDQDSYERVKDSPQIVPRTFSELYGVPEEQIDLYHSDVALAVKISFPRPWVSGSRYDRDVYGGQIHGPLVELELTS